MSRSTRDPIINIRMLNRVAIPVGAAGVIASAVWAWWPVSVASDVQAERLPQPLSASTTAGLSLIDWDTFDVVMWQPFPETVVAEPPKPTAVQPTPVLLELLAIAADPHDALSAVLYDPATHKIHKVAAGQSIGDHQIEGIDMRGVDVTLAGRLSRLHLRQDTP